jgi:hypothetical protein
MFAGYVVWIAVSVFDTVQEVEEVAAGSWLVYWSRLEWRL